MNNNNMHSENNHLKRQAASLLHLAAAAILLGAAAAIALGQDTPPTAGGATNSSATTKAKLGYDARGHKLDNETKYKEIAVPETLKFLSDHPDAVILDLRTPREYAAGHLPNATNYSVQNDATYQAILAPLDKTKWYVVHSAVGHWRTVRALEYFETNDFQHVVAIDGGYGAWTNAGQPVIKPEPKQAAATASQQ
jgi:rhodanese-related sulfurtransferase